MIHTHRFRNRRYVAFEVPKGITEVSVHPENVLRPDDGCTVRFAGDVLPRATFDPDGRKTGTLDVVRTGQRAARGG